MTGCSAMAKTTAPASEIPTPLRIFCNDAARLDPGMDPAVDDQHRPRLGGKARRRRTGEIAARLRDACGAVADPEHAIRLQVEIGRATLAGVGAVQLLPFLDVEANGGLIFLEHARVHREGEPLPLGFQGVGERGERAVGPAVGALPEEPDVVVGEEIEGADGEARPVEIFRGAGGPQPRLA